MENFNYNTLIDYVIDCNHKECKYASTCNLYNKEAKEDLYGKMFCPHFTTVFDKLMSFEKEDWIEWLAENFYSENAPWEKWVNKEYCSKCDTVIIEFPNSSWGPQKAAPCEVGPCPRGDVDKWNDKDVIRHWLDSVEENM